MACQMRRVNVILITAIVWAFFIGCAIVNWRLGHIENAFVAIAVLALYGIRLPRVLSAHGHGLIDDSAAFAKLFRCKRCGLLLQDECNCSSAERSTVRKYGASRHTFLTSREFIHTPVSALPD